MNLELNFHPAAEEQLLAAHDRYAERSHSAARAFFHEVAVVVDRVLAAPERWPAYLHGTRRVVFPRFPFSWSTGSKTRTSKWSRWLITVVALGVPEHR